MALRPYHVETISSAQASARLRQVRAQFVKRDEAQQVFRSRSQGWIVARGAGRGLIRLEYFGGKDCPC